MKTGERRRACPNSCARSRTDAPAETDSDLVGSIDLLQDVPRYDGAGFDVGGGDERRGRPAKLAAGDLGSDNPD